MHNANGSAIPDVNSRWTIVGGAITTIGVWVVSLAGVAVPAEVASSATLLIAVVVGIVAGDNSHARRATDPGNGK